MRVNLSNDQWVDIVPADELLDGDRKAVNASITVEVTEDNRALMPGDYEDIQRDAMLTRVITNWSFQMPIPAEDPKSLNRLTIKQGRELAKVVDEHMALVRGQENPGERGSVPTSA